MNREIKFRLWSVSARKYFGPYSIYKINYENCHPDDYEPEQFTGLKDRNDVEIYEGDIDRKHGEVMFWKGAFGFLHEDNHGFTNLFEVWVRNELEIIGNIHESPKDKHE